MPSVLEKDALVYTFLDTFPTLEASGNGWRGWKLRMQRAAVTGGVLEHLDGTTTRPTSQVAQSAWDFDEARTLNYLVAKLSDSLACQLDGLSAAEAWACLCTRFEPSHRESLQSIMAALRSFKAKNLNAVGEFLDKHEEVLSYAREIGFVLVRDAPVGSSAAETTEARDCHYIYSDFILAGLPATPEWKAWVATYRSNRLSTYAPRKVLDKIRVEYNRLCANTTTNPEGPIFAKGSDRDSTVIVAIAHVGSVKGSNGS